jgi:hypothetical protein
MTRATASHRVIARAVEPGTRLIEVQIPGSVRRRALRLVVALALVLLALYATATAATTAWSGRPNLDQATRHVLPSPAPVGP